jgi:hypothetical protein
MSSTYDLRHYRDLVVVEEDRYTGAYSGALFTAWWGIPPDDIDAGDMECGEFWRTHKDVLCGMGNTPQAAFQDLAKKVDAAGWLFEPRFADVPNGIKYGEHLYFLCASPEFFTWLSVTEKAIEVNRALAHEPLQIKQ